MAPGEGLTPNMSMNSLVSLCLPNKFVLLINMYVFLIFLYVIYMSMYISANLNLM